MTEGDRQIHRRLADALKFRSAVAGRYLVWESAERVALCFRKDPEGMKTWLGAFGAFSAFAGAMVLVSGGSWGSVVLVEMACLTVFLVYWKAYKAAPELEELIGCTRGDFPRLEVALNGWTGRPVVDITALAVRRASDSHVEEGHSHWLFLYAVLRDRRYLPIHAELEYETNQRHGFLYATREFSEKIGLSLMEPPVGKAVVIPSF
jgi:hypothetical protein